MLRVLAAILTLGIAGRGGRPRFGASAYSGRPSSARKVVACLLLLGAAAWCREWVLSARKTVITEEPRFADELATRMPALVLTGMRGPAVTTMWLAAEQGKQDRDWEALQTYYSAIAALQPHFAQGYLMNGWNSAYNMSVQFNSLSVKYRWIQKGIDLLRDGDRRNPDNIDLVGYLSDLVGDKLGRSSEKIYYDLMFRDDTRGLVLPPLPPDPSIERATNRETGLATGDLLDPLGKGPKAEDRAKEWPVGETFRDGICPLAVGWWYAEKTRRIQAATGDRHHQFGPPVLSSRPVLMLRDWAYREHEIARYRAKECFDGRPYEMQFFDIGQLSDFKRAQLAAVRGTPDLIAKTRAHYELSARVFEFAASEYKLHLKRFAEVDKGEFGDYGLYTRHLQNAWFDRKLVQANRAAFEGLLIVGRRLPGTVKDVDAKFAEALGFYRAALGDPSKYDWTKVEDWGNREDIGILPYTEIFLKPTDEIRSEDRQDVIADIAYYKGLIRILENCRSAIRSRPGAKVDELFPVELTKRLIGWVIYRDPPKPIGT